MYFYLLVIFVYRIKMAALALESVVEPTSISPEYVSIQQCVKELYTSFEWRKKKSDITSFLKLLNAIVAKQGTTLETMERVSLEHAKNYTSIFGTYNYIPYNSIERKQEITSINYISVPYVVYLGEDNTTWIIFRTASSFIPEITPEMMDIIKYLGVVRVFISGNFSKTIPYFPDNVIQIQFDSSASLIGSDNINFGIPKYLLGFYDCTGTYNSTPIPLGYTLRLPSTLVELITSELTTPNLPPNLTYLKYCASYTTIDEPNKASLDRVCFQSIPLSVKRLTLAGFACTNTDYTMNPGMEYLALDIGNVNGNCIRFDNVKTVIINSSFKPYSFVCQNRINRIKSKPHHNFVKIAEYPCGECGDGSMIVEYKLVDFTVSLGDSVSHLDLHFYDSLNILNYLDLSTPNNLQSITIRKVFYVKTYDDVLQRHQLLLKKIQKYKSEDKHSIIDENDLYDLETIINFHTRFPDVKIILCS
jgi:hypothetical protein